MRKETRAALDLLTVYAAVYASPDEAEALARIIEEELEEGEDDGK